MSTDDTSPDQRVGFRDIYRAVGESEARVKEHISLVLLPISQTLADHEVRLRMVEGDVSIIKDAISDETAKSGERSRIAGITNRTIILAVLVSNFVLGLIVMFANLLSKPA